LVVISCVQTVFIGFAYVTWMTSFTETVEAHNPALTATGLAIWGWLVRLVVTACFLCLPLVVKSVTPLIEAPYYMAAYQQALANHVTPPAPLLDALGVIKAAAAAAPGEWQKWYWICIGVWWSSSPRSSSCAGAGVRRRHAPTRQSTTRPWHASCTPCKEVKEVKKFLLAVPGRLRSAPGQ
jgi:hypothetical protein